jgi:DNA replication protein DnaC
MQRLRDVALGKATPPTREENDAWDAESAEWDARLQREAAERDAEERRNKTPSMLVEAGYPKRHIANLGKMEGPGMAVAKELAPRLCERGSDGLMFLIGDRGPGKTQIATWFAAERIRLGAGPGKYRKALNLWQEIRAAWKDSSDVTEEQVVSKYGRASFLVIDEGQERGDTESDRQWCDRMFTHLIDQRYDAMLPTLIIANLSPERFEATIPASIRSRATEAGGVKVCDWPSYRVSTPQALK